jgi:hypothetical protein
MIGLSIDDGKEVLSSSGVVESRGDEVMEIVVSDFFWMDFFVVIGFLRLVESLVKISLSFVGLEDLKVVEAFVLSSFGFEFCSGFGLDLHFDCYCNMD